MKKYWLVLWCLLFGGLVWADIDITLSSHHLKLGEPLRVDIKTTHKIKRSQLVFANNVFDIYEKKLTKYEKELPETFYKYIAYVAASRKRMRGKVLLKLDIVLQNEERTRQRYDIFLDYKPPPKGKISLSKKKNKISSNQRMLRKEGSLIGLKFRKKTNFPYFKTAFIQPVQGRITSVFGQRRLYNGTYSRSHAGVDIANKEGSKIYSPNRGRVILSRRLDVHGHTIMIDHGYGIVTIYNHLYRRLVKEGQLVNKNRLIGLLGETGVATAPHLHWGMGVQNVRVDPMFWLNNHDFVR